MKRTVAMIGLGMAALLLAGCSSEPDTSEASEVSEAIETESESQQEPRREVRRRADQQEVEPQPEQRPTQREMGDPLEEILALEGELDEDSYGLTMVVDGSSPEAFLQSLELIAGESSNEQFQGLKSTLRYLQFYSPSPDFETFVERLDGMTGEEIIEQAQSRRR